MGTPETPPRDRTAWVKGMIWDTLLDHGTREDVMATLHTTPGLNGRQIAQSLNIAGSTLRHHLEPLEHRGVVERREGHREHENLWFAAEDVHLWEDERTRPLFGGSPLREVALYLEDNPGLTAQQIGNALDRTPSAIYPHLRTLREHGLIDRERVGTTHIHWAEPPLEAWAEEVGTAYREVYGDGLPAEDRPDPPAQRERRNPAGQTQAPPGGQDHPPPPGDETMDPADED